LQFNNALDIMASKFNQPVISNTGNISMGCVPGTPISGVISAQGRPFDAKISGICKPGQEETEA
jgi:hypothetical protein